MAAPVLEKVTRWGAILLAVSSVAGRVWAGEAEGAATQEPGTATERPLRVLLWVSEPSGPRFAERLAGQTSDLPVRLLPLVSPAQAEDTTRHLAQLQSLAIAQEAKIVVWVDAPTSGKDHLVLKMVDIESHLALTREMGSGEDDSDAPRSATLEAVAIVVREALQVFLAHETLEGFGEVAEIPTAALEPLPPATTPTATLKPLPPATPATSTPTAAPPPRQPDRPPSPTQTPIRPIVGFSWNVVRDGFAPRAQHGPSMLAGGRAKGLEGGVLVQSAYPTEASSPYGTIHLWRHAGSFWLGVRRPLTPGLLAGARLQVGAVGYHRHLEPAPEVTPTDDRFIFSPLVGGSGHGAWSVGKVSLVLSAGLQLVPRKLEIGVTREAEYVPILASAPLQGWLAAGLEVELSRGGDW